MTQTSRRQTITDSLHSPTHSQQKKVSFLHAEPVGGVLAGLNDEKHQGATNKPRMQCQDSDTKENIGRKAAS